ncbi:hypothetical protein [Burkholderia anthina]|uniref:hypothetical protein n=1 Tax=Burkholderia anthina TaxID=179879 RepID=UPI00158DC976|nr:hypothetical protein [Burkholderia anthina]
MTIPMTTPVHAELTEGQIGVLCDRATKMMENGSDGFLKQWGLLQYTRAVIETYIETTRIGEPRNGEDLLDHCRAFERLLTAQHALDLEKTFALHGGRSAVASAAVPGALANLRDSIRTAEESMKLGAPE